MVFRKRKIFCIGFNKSGTSSLHDFFQSCGLSSTHDTDWPYYSHLKYGWLYFRKTCYTDGEFSEFVNLDRWFPGSLFILNTRDERKWLISRIKHVLRYNETVDKCSIMSDPRYGKMAREFFFNEEAAIQKWILEKRIYSEQARCYFKGRAEFLEIDVTVSNEWSGEIQEFFARNKFLVSKTGSPYVPHKNARPKENIENQELLTKYTELALSIIDRLAPPDTRKL